MKTDSDPDQAITHHLLERVCRHLRIDPWGIHGLSHWSRVCANGTRIATRNGAEIVVVCHFALLHDSCRENEGSDPDHGPRAAAFAGKLYKEGLLDLTPAQFTLLETACRLHTMADSHADRTVRTCFDADRLDLGRVGKQPDPMLLTTAHGRSKEMRSWAHERSIRNHLPDNFLGRHLRSLRDTGRQ